MAKRTTHPAFRLAASYLRSDDPRVTEISAAALPFHAHVLLGTRLDSTIAAGADVNVPFDPRPPLSGGLPSFVHWSPLHFAVISGSTAKVRKILSFGGDPLLFLGDVTPLGLAAYTGNVEALKLFRNKGVSLDLLILQEHNASPDMLGSSLFHRVLAKPFFEGKTDVALFLLEYYMKDRDGKLPVDAAGRTPFSSALADDAFHSCMAYMSSKEAVEIASTIRSDDKFSHKARSRL